MLTSTSEVYGDPLEHPQPETYWGNVNPIGMCFYIILTCILALNEIISVAMILKDSCTKINLEDLLYLTCVKYKWLIV